MREFWGRLVGVDSTRTVDKGRRKKGGEGWKASYIVCAGRAIGGTWKGKMEIG